MSHTSITILIPCRICRWPTEWNNPEYQNTRNQKKEKQGVTGDDQQWPEMSDSSQMQHPKPTLCSKKTSGKLETRELFRKFIPFDSQGLHPPSLAAQKGNMSPHLGMPIRRSVGRKPMRRMKPQCEFNRACRLVFQVYHLLFSVDQLDIDVICRSLTPQKNTRKEKMEPDGCSWHQTNAHFKEAWWTLFFPSLSLLPVKRLSLFTYSFLEFSISTLSYHTILHSLIRWSNISPTTNHASQLHLLGPCPSSSRILA